MAARGDNNFMRYVYRGEEDEDIPEGATHIIVHEDVTVILARAFSGRHNIIEVICHEGVEKIEQEAFWWCYSLRRVVMPGVGIVERDAFNGCTALTDLECGKLEIIKDDAFTECESLRSINLPSARIVDVAFCYCYALTDAKFGSKLERIEGMAFLRCCSLERITIPLKDGLITDDNIFVACDNLKRVDLVKGELHETIDALLLDDWRNDMNEEIDSIYQIISTVDAGRRGWNSGEMAVAIRDWIRSLLEKIIDCKAEHRRLLDEDVAPTIQRFLPQDIVMNSILPFLELPSHSFEVESHEKGEEEDSDDDEEYSWEEEDDEEEGSDDDEE